MEVSMKSKLFLSLSLLTAVFSISAQYKFPPHILETHLYRGHTLPTYFQRFSSAITSPTAKLVGTVAAPAVAVAGLYTAGSKLNSYMNPEVAPKLTYVQQAQQMIQNGYNSVKANAVKGYNSSLTFVKANPKSTAGAVAAVAALGYVAYNSDLFGKSKAPVVTAPVAKAPVAKAAKRHLGAF